MGKRSQGFARAKRQFYPTPYEAVVPLFPHLLPNTKFIEPCAGDGRLIRHLESQGHQCTYACDIEPQAAGIERKDVLMMGSTLPAAEYIISNTPWERFVLHQMIEKFRLHAPTWLIFEADWAYTIQAAPYLKYCAKIVSVGRVKWIEGSKTSGMENCSWYLFLDHPCTTVFVGRQ